MDPRNPLGRLDRLALRAEVRRLTLTFENGAAGCTRGVEVVTRDGARRAFALEPGTSWVDLLDRLAAHLDRMQRRKRGARR